MSRIHRRWIAVLLLMMVVGAAARVARAQEWRNNQLRLIVSVAGGVARAEGLSFDLFGTPSAADLVFSFVNDSDESIVVTPSFAERIVFAIQRDGRPVPVKVQWVSTEISRADDEFASTTLITALNVEPQGVLRLTARLTPQGKDVFPAGKYVVALNTLKAAERVQNGKGEQWRGHHAGEGTLTIYIVDPKTPEDVRRRDLAAGSDALLHDDPATALKHFSEMVRRNPGDLEAQAGLGQAHLELRHYKEAASAFEAVLPSLRRGERSLLYSQAAFAYLALGQDARAEQILTAAYGTEGAKRQLIDLREALRKR